MAAIAILPSLLPAQQEFQKVVVPFFHKYCYECHDADLKKGDLDLEAVRDDSGMFRQQRMWRELVQLVSDGQMPPSKKKVRPTQPEIDALSGAVTSLLRRATAAQKTDPGAVTVRRLNRTEFNATVRDLCLVEGDFSADFPADDTGYGYDNIGDVLSFSPVHLERFLAAGERIAALALPDKSSALDSFNLDLSRMLPRGKVEQQARYFLPATTITGEVEAPRDGEYVARVDLWAGGDRTDPPAEVSVTVAGRPVGRLSVKTSPTKRFGTHEVKFALTAGKHELKLTWTNAPAAGSRRSLSGHRVRLIGPLDGRSGLQHRLAEVAGRLEGEARARAVVNWFVSRAFRRPVNAAEMSRYVKVFLDAEKAGGAWEDGARAVVSVSLASPKFVFRAEQDERPTQPDAHPVGEFVLASRLSYFLWGSMPDDVLLQEAFGGRLHAGLADQAARLLRDPRSAHLVNGFGIQWLQLRRLSVVEPDPKQFPEFDDAMRVAMSRETELFFAEVIREDRPLTDLLDADFTYVNAALARLYGLPHPGTRTAEEFVRVSLPKGERGGLLTQASILTATSNPDRTSPVKRGKWILEQILGTPPPPAPAGVAALESQKELKGSLRERMEQHRANPSCATCHNRMDAIGFAFERFDAIGRLRDVDEGRRIDPAGVLPDGRAFKGAADLKRLLRADERKFVRNLAANLLTFALGRGLDYYDEPALDEIVDKTLKGGSKFSVMVRAVVESAPFRLRRGASQVANVSAPANTPR
ncbi:MAG: DUF1592 domain-containing protein [Opitutales bacterium]